MKSRTGLTPLQTEMRCEPSRSVTGFTMMEILISMGLFVILIALGLVAMNPGRQIASARNTQRSLHLNALMDGIRQNMADTSGGGFTCAAGAIPTSTAARMASVGTPPIYDIGPCLVPIYLPTMPFDPSLDGVYFESLTNYDTGYTVVRNASTGVITVSAPGSELGVIMSVAR